MLMFYVPFEEVSREPLCFPRETSVCSALSDTGQGLTEAKSDTEMFVISPRGFEHHHHHSYYAHIKSASYYSHPAVSRFIC